MEKTGGTAYLILEDGTVFEGRSFGARGEATGELVFTTAMTGYLETLTDPSYYGQIVLQIFPLIGNYGVIPSDFESASPRLTAYIVRQWCRDPSNFRSEGDLDTFFLTKNIVGLCGIDTRRLAKIIREHGVMNARITEDLPKRELCRRGCEVVTLPASAGVGAGGKDLQIEVWAPGGEAADP